MAIAENILNGMLIEAFPAAEIKIIDLAGDGDHYEVHIADSSFAGMSKIAQHKLVYQALGDKVGGDLHALALKTSIK
jgi:stress-induced morphogen